MEFSRIGLITDTPSEGEGDPFDTL